MNIVSFHKRDLQLVIQYLSIARIIRLSEELRFFSANPNRSFGAVTRIRLDAMSGPIRKLIGRAKTRLQRYVEEASSLLSSTVEEKIVMEDKLRVEEVIVGNCSY